MKDQINLHGGRLTARNCARHFNPAIEANLAKRNYLAGAVSGVIA